MVQQAPARLHLDKQIDVTLFVCLPPYYRSEDAYVSSAMLSSGAEDFLAFCLQKFLYIHTLFPLALSRGKDRWKKEDGRWKKRISISKRPRDEGKAEGRRKTQDGRNG
jgi:hypothetical protein